MSQTCRKDCLNFFKKKMEHAPERKVITNHRMYVIIFEKKKYTVADVFFV